MKFFTFAAGLVCLAMLAGTGCRLAFREDQRETAQVAAALARYRQLAMASDANGVAGMYEIGGEISHATEKPRIGRENIGRFLQLFVNYKILAYDLTATSTTVDGAAAIQRGSYRQTVVTPDGQTVHAQGTFEVRWARQPDGTWLVHRMHTESAPVQAGS